MTFTEPRFFILTAIVYLLWLTMRGHYRAQIALLVLGSLIFYGAHRPWLLILLLSYCLVNWGVGLWIAKRRRPRMALTCGVTWNLLVLAFWKYTPLLLGTFGGSEITPKNWIIPFGISFYAFTGIAYMVEVYRKRTPAEEEFWRYTLSTAFYPQLVAGPILRPGDFLEKLTPEQFPTKGESHLEAIMLLGRGYFKKLVLADRIALLIDPFFAHVADSSTEGVCSLIFIYLYAFQIYFDFSAYTDIARGLGLLFGYRWPENFFLPYLATSIQQFWQRWHVTLSTFLRDYLYVSLGGNRRGMIRTGCNLMLTMLLGGLWHGASWSFLIWGGLHGFFLILHRIWSRLGFRSENLLWKGCCWLLTFHCICLAWCFFRLTRLNESLICVKKCFVFNSENIVVGGLNDFSLWILLASYGAVIWATQSLIQRAGDRNSGAIWYPAYRGFLWGGAIMLLLMALVLSPAGEKPPFIYFQF